MIKKAVLLMCGIVVHDTVAMDVKPRYTAPLLIASMQKSRASNLFEQAPSFTDWTAEIAKIKTYLAENAGSDKTLIALFNTYVDLFKNLFGDINRFYQFLNPAPTQRATPMKAAISISNNFNIILAVLMTLNASVHDFKFYITGKKNSLAVLYAFGLGLEKLAGSAYQESRTKLNAIARINRTALPNPDQSALMAIAQNILMQIKARLK